MASNRRDGLGQPTAWPTSHQAPTTDLAIGVRCCDRAGGVAPAVLSRSLRVRAAALVRDAPGGLSAAEVFQIVDAVAEALDFAYERRLLHRDVKPGNILLTTPVRGKRRILLADFGIARQVDDVSRLTATNFAVGTITYAAPEQLMGEPLDGRADQYALAATAYHLLAGSPPFVHSNPTAVIKHLNAAPPNASTARPELAAIDAVLARGLAKEPADRYPTCVEFASALRDAERYSPPVAIAGDSPAEPTVAAGAYVAAAVPQRPGPAGSESDHQPGTPRRPWWRRRRVLVAAGAVAMVVVTATALGLFGLGDHRSVPKHAEVLPAGLLRPQEALVSVDAPDPTLLENPVVGAARPSVVKIRSVPSRCQKVVEGSGFVVAPDKVMSTAHVVAGSGSVTVQADGKTYDATVVSYDFKDDISLLNVPGLPSPPLQFNTQVAPRGAEALAFGYPVGGDFAAVPARIREMIELSGPNIYHTTTVTRQMYAFRGVVRKGITGAPLIDLAGKVLGVVVGADADDADTGFALGANEVDADMANVANGQPVTTGDCVPTRGDVARN